MPSTHILLVAGARHLTGTEDTSFRPAILCYGVAAPAFLGIFQSGELEALVVAVLDANLDSHVISRLFGIWESPTLVGRVTSAAKVLELQCARNVLEPPLRLRDLRRRAAASLRLCVLLPILDGVAARQGVKLAKNWLVDLDRNSTTSSCLVVEKFQDTTLLDAPAVVRALCDGGLQHVNVPSVEKVAMEPESSRVTRSCQQRRHHETYMTTGRTRWKIRMAACHHTTGP